MSKPKVMKVPAMRFIQHGRAHFSISLNPRLLNFLKRPIRINRYDAGKDGEKFKGYQRNQDEKKRIDEIAKYVADTNNNLVDPISLNVPNEKHRLAFEPISQSCPSLGYLMFPDDLPINNYDGGHRELGYDKAIESASDIDFELPATLVNVEEQEEAMLFALKNCTQQRIASDLLLDIKVSLNGELQKKDGVQRSLPSKMTDDINWLASGREIANILNTENTGFFANNPWFGKMRYANVNGAKMPNVKEYFKLGKFTEYIRPIAANGFGLLPDSNLDRAKLLCNFWKAAAKCVPEAFGPNATDYRLATGHVSIEPLHRLVNSFMLYIFHKGNFRKGGQPLYETFQDAANAVADKAGYIPTVAEFEAVFKKCYVQGFGDGGKGAPLMTAKHWHINGLSRHYHGKGNVSILVNEVMNSLGIPPKKKVAA